MVIIKCPCVGHGGLSAHFQALSSVLREIELVIKWCAEHLNGPSTHLTGLETRLPERASDSSLHSARVVVRAAPIVRLL